MTTRTKSIALFTLSCTFTACDKEPEKQPVTAPPVEVKSPAQPPKKLSTFQQEIQKMLDGAKGDEAVLRSFLKGKPREDNVKYVKEGLNYYVSKHGKRPDKKLLIDTLLRLNLLHIEILNEESLDRIEKKLADQLKKEKGQ